MDEYFDSKMLESELSATGNSPTLSSQEFTYFAALIFRHAGIKLGAEKRKMLEIRLSKRLRALNLTSFDAYLHVLQQDPSGTELVEFTNAVTTNKTEFFREQYHFDFLVKDILAKRHRESVFIWSAACASGEEPYSIAMVCEEIRRERINFDYRILSTDVDTQRLAMSQEGTYAIDKLGEIPLRYHDKYLCFQNARTEDTFQVAEHVRNYVKFRQHNLIHYPEKYGIQFHYIFLRNVLFYFDRETSEKVVSSLVSQLQPGGLFFVGLTETLQHMDVGIEQVGSSVYQKVAT
ncbi:protein-glutamate O-methyltransferase CheR [Enterovibrio sp. ZSDZ35]|uniref:Chemotaxis protein methyltransferase n=1 Tax=Enterovibrio qingdaonensis TaxID=2899818 RepID=A0ABT5QQE8_9GAMM|nr:protein-glutamate O-methyltransferase CheR [Enterovibrio sp. ZSDZ35]MDD1783207.1 protein-glutamate O-methyltransferase CheR [Enterovibrio sp. ZSDZ35]